MSGEMVRYDEGDKAPRLWQDVQNAAVLAGSAYERTSIFERGHIYPDGSVDYERVSVVERR